MWSLTVEDEYKPNVSENKVSRKAYEWWSGQHRVLYDNKHHDLHVQLSPNIVRI